MERTFVPTPQPRSWRPEVLVDGQWSTNSLRYATEAEAWASAVDLAHRWRQVTGGRARPSQDPVTAEWKGELLPPPTPEQAAHFLLRQLAFPRPENPAPLNIRALPGPG